MTFLFRFRVRFQPVGVRGARVDAYLGKYPSCPVFSFDEAIVEEAWYKWPVQIHERQVSTRLYPLHAALDMQHSKT